MECHHRWAPIGVGRTPNWQLEVSIFPGGEHQCPEQKLSAHRELLVVDPRSHESNMMDLEHSPPIWHTSVNVSQQIFVVGIEETRRTQD
jgi:hypothetical protein